MDVLLVVAVLAAAVLLIAAPLRVRGGADAPVAGQRAALEAAKADKYREIRDAELDHRTGKLSREDWQRMDAALRAEALELLRRLDGLEGEVRSPKQA
jgi:hypothetical protein